MRTICIVYLFWYYAIANYLHNIKHMKYLIGIIVTVLLAVAGWYISTNQNLSEETTTLDTNNSTVKVVTSIYPLAFIAEEITGDLAQVTNIGEGQDPHDFRPTARDIQAMQDSDLLVLQGAELEPWGEEVQEQLENSGNRVLVATEGLSLYEAEEEHKDDHDDHDEHSEEEHGDEHDKHEDEHKEEKEHEENDDHDDHEHGLYDPHTWLDPVLVSLVAESIAQELIAIDSANRSTYEQNLASLQEKLSVLDSEYTQVLSKCSLGEVITSHDAFGYVARRYDFEVHAIAGLSTQDKPSAVTLGQLREEAAEGIGAILLEDNNITAYGETLASETGLQTLSINPIVYSIPQGQDYFDIMRSNLNSFQTALQCNE